MQMMLQTLVEADHSVNTAVARGARRGVAVDRKPELMVMELKRFGMNVIGISESKWFWYMRLGDLQSYRRSTPSERESGEGVGIV